MSTPDPRSARSPGLAAAHLDDAAACPEGATGIAEQCATSAVHTDPCPEHVGPTGAPEVPLEFAGTPLYRLMHTRGAQLAPRFADLLREQLPTYRRLPPEVLDVEVAALVTRMLRVSEESLRTGRQPDEATLRTVVESAALRAEEGVPLSEVLSAYGLGCRLWLQALLEAAAPTDLPAARALVDHTLALLGAVTSAGATGYLGTIQVNATEQQTARQALFDALLDGGDAAGVAARVGLTLPPRYVALSLSFGRHADERAADVDRAIAARRKLRRIIQTLVATDPAALSSLTSESGIVLLPSRDPVVPGTEIDWTPARRLTARLADSAGARVLAGVAAAVPRGVGEAIRLATEIRKVAQRLGRRDGLVILDDVLVEYQLSRPTPASESLAQLLVPLAEHPSVLETLRAFVVDGGLNRRRVATRLKIHPNTVDYRLRRATELIGLSPTEPADALRIMAAFAALEALDAGPADDRPRRG